MELPMVEGFPLALYMPLVMVLAPSTYTAQVTATLRCRTLGS